MIQYFIYKLSPTTGAFCVSCMGQFEKPTDVHNDKVMDGMSIEKITSIFWCVNAAGSVKLSWKAKEEGHLNMPFVVLSGNGKWDLGSADFICPDMCDGTVLLTAEGFDDLDSFTIIITGKSKENNNV